MAIPSQTVFHALFAPIAFPLTESSRNHRCDPASLRFYLGDTYANQPPDPGRGRAARRRGEREEHHPDDDGLLRLDRVQRAGARAWINLSSALDLSRDTASRKQRLAEIVQRMHNHPALLVWEGPDEILWNNWWVTMEKIRPELNTMSSVAGGKPELALIEGRARDMLDRALYVEFEKARSAFWDRAGQPPPNPGVRLDDAPDRVRQSADGITEGIRTVREMDPRHVLWLNHAPRNSLEDLRLYNRAADMVGCDIYPAPANLMVGHSDLPDMTLGSVGAYTKRMRVAAAGKACAMVLQGFGWRDLRETLMCMPPHGGSSIRYGELEP